MIRVLMIGPDRKVHGGISAVVNNYYEAGLDREVKLKYLSTMVDGSKIKKLLWAMMAYLKFLITLPSFTILHVNMASDASYYRKKVFIDTASFFKKKIVIHEHGGDFQDFYRFRLNNKQKDNLKRTLNKAEKFIVLSKQWYTFFSEIVEEKKLLIMENGIILPESAEKDYDNHNLLFLGRICREKGIAELIEAVEQIRRKIPDVHLYLGGVFEDGSLKRLTEGKEDYITCPGWVGSEEKKRMFKECSIFVLPSYFEGQPISLMEAMAEGLCVVASEVGGIPQIIERSEQGILVEPKNEAALEKALFRLLENINLRKSMGEAASERIRSQYNVVKNKEMLLQLYRELNER